MVAYYNEHDAYAAAWLRNLIAEGLIAPGLVDERDIRDVRPSDLDGFVQCHFFAGIGVWSYALRLAGWPDERPIWTGSCPCQPFSAAGRGAGFADERHLWPHWHHLIRECGPADVFGEQVASKDGLGWFDLVQADLEGSGYACGAADLCAAGVGAPHIRQRLWFVAHAGGHGLQGCQPAQQADRGRRLADQSGPLSGLANAAGERRDRSELARAARAAPARSPEESGRGPAGLRESAGRGAAIWLGDASGAGGRRNTRAVSSAQGEGPCERGGAGRQSDEPVAAGAARGLAHADGRHTSAEGLQRSGQYGQQPQNGVAGFWADADWIACRDGKARPVEPGTFPLAHGAPARVGRLRAYGNAINAEAAAAFIRAADGALLEAECVRLGGVFA